MAETIKWSEVRLKPEHPAKWCQINVELRPVTINKAGEGTHTGWRLSITGDLGAYPHQESDAFKCADGITRRSGSCDQLREELVQFFPEVTPHLKYHLNTMRPGCEHQRTEKWDEKPIDPTKPLNVYGKYYPGQRSSTWNMLGRITPQEHPDGLLTKPCPTCGYRYGSAWRYETLPPETLMWASKGEITKEERT